MGHLLLNLLDFEMSCAFTVFSVHSFDLFTDMDNKILFSQMVYGEVHTRPMAFAFMVILDD